MRTPGPTVDTVPPPGNPVWRSGMTIGVSQLARGMDPVRPSDKPLVKGAVTDRGAIDEPIHAANDQERTCQASQGVCDRPGLCGA